jgi:DNA polymerase-3 subunit delta
LVSTLDGMAEDTTVAFFAREDGRAKAPERLRAAVLKAGGAVDEEGSVKPWELPKWVIARARELKLELAGDAARALVAHVGDRQQRLLRELEKLALEFDPGSAIDGDMIEELCAPSAERRAWSLADALVAGEPRQAVRMLLQTRAQGERLPGLIYWMSSRLREAHRVAVALDAGEAPAQIRRSLRMPPRVADQLISDAGRAGAEKLRAAIEAIAELELASRGGGPGGASEDTAALLAVRQIAA